MTSKLTPFVFKSSGYTITVRRVSPLLALEIQKAYPAPTPPMQEVDYGDGKKRMEANAANPEYLAQKAEWERDMEERTRRLIIKRGVIHTLSDEEKQAVKEIREFFVDDMKKELSYNDLEVFIYFVAIESAEELTDLVNAILSVSQPTESEVKTAQDSFPGNV